MLTTVKVTVTVVEGRRTSSVRLFSRQTWADRGVADSCSFRLGECGLQNERVYRRFRIRWRVPHKLHGNFARIPCFRERNNTKNIRSSTPPQTGRTICRVYENDTEPTFHYAHSRIYEIKSKSSRRHTAPEQRLMVIRLRSDRIRR